MSDYSQFPVFEKILFESYHQSIRSYLQVSIRFTLFTLVSAALPLLVIGSPLNSEQQFTTATRASSFAPAQWVHLCFVVDKEKLDFVRAQVANKPQPWTNAYNQMLKDSDKYGKYVSGTRTSETVSNVSCGPTTKP
ncbi:uncharacterized protein RAG0_15697 [Rhynchosporium agropyri]|uniref:Uncharacterized protein n=1 Tax=Rhynchosporium agropyri TaxID=914238 RepID=A0A1E1LMC0_9HELO|nr:uncharacterized protein RAG0_15697 [Rhynchosporium agropyri]